MNKKTIILIILSIAAVLSIIYGIITPAPKRRYQTIVPASQTPRGALQQESGTQNNMERIVPTRRRAKRTALTSWGRNPFVPKGASSVGALTLNGIMWCEGRPRAMINNEIVGIGDKIGSNTVIDIKKDYVVVNDGTNNFVIKLE